MRRQSTHQPGPTYFKFIFLHFWSTLFESKGSLKIIYGSLNQTTNKIVMKIKLKVAIGNFISSKDGSIKTEKFYISKPF